MQIEELYNLKILNERSYNICKNNYLNDIFEILEHFKKFKTFKNFRNCGDKSNEQLIDLCMKYNIPESTLFAETLTPEKQLGIKINNFTRTQTEIVNSFIETITNNLSNKSKNVLNFILNKNFKIQNISTIILTNEGFNLKKIRNIGTKRETELNIFLKSIIEFIEKVSEIVNEDDLVSLRNKFYLQKIFTNSTIPNEILDSQSIFSLIDFLITNELLFNKNESIIFQKTLKIYNERYGKTLDNVAKELNVSRERVRQIRENIINNLFTNLSFVKFFENDLYKKYNFDQYQNFINIDINLNKLINEDNKTNFTIEFNTFLIYVYYSDNFSLVGEIEDVLQNKYFTKRESHNWNNFYLINKKLTNNFNFNKLVDDIYNKINSRIDITYSLHFKGYLSKFLNNNDSSLLLEVSSISEIILNQEFELFIDINDNIVFKRNTVKQISEFVIEALKELGKPSSIEDIYNLITKDDPEITKSKESLRGSINRVPDIIYFGRSSTYGLKQWEIDKEGIKGGTIRSIVFEFLQDQNQPIHITLIMNHLRKYRDGINEHSIISNLKRDSENRFIIYNQRFIGLQENEKNFNEKYKKLPEHLGKIIISMYRNEKTINEINLYLQSNFKLTFEEASYIINYLQII